MIRSYFRRLSSFTYLNATQFLGALNDNIYKLLIVYFLITLKGIESSHEILAMTGAVFVIPFLLLSALSGVMADRFSKRDIIVFTKILELVTMGLAVIAFAFESVWGSYVVLFLLAAQSALFGPSKYGIVPELVSTDKISSANGMMTSFTFFAIILGTILASFLTEVTGRNFVISSLFCTFIALVGLVTSFCIEPTLPSGSHKKIKLFFISEIYHSLRIASRHVSLLPAVLGAAFFLFVGAFTQLNMIPFAIESLHMSDTEGGYLFFLTALGIGLGALTAGKVSGRIVELGLVPFGAIGISISFFLLSYFATNFWVVLPLVTFIGFFGGVYEIPLDSYIQVASPKISRGQIVAATNFMSFIGVLCASALVYFNFEFFGLKANQGFAIMGVLSLFVFIFFAFQFFDYLTRFIGSILSKLHFKVFFKGQENIPDCPAVYICPHRDWNDTLLLLGAQRRRMRFFIECEQKHSSHWLHRLYLLLRVVFVPDIEPLERNQKCLEVIQKSLKSGISVCIFVESEHLFEEIQKLHQSPRFCEIIVKANYPVIPVQIHKSTKHSRFRFFQGFFNKIQVPASILFGQVVYPGEESLLKEKHEHELCFEE
jgi:acyl-[acyl-carrier-protein]-phospholipid O-acyltransferase / long-chain-fatty-acid--[acyl-carrier-protein] ligase